jgi:1,4-alpha-glucan branching enzyme
MKTAQRKSSNGQARTKQGGVSTPVSVAAGPGPKSEKKPDGEGTICFRLTAPGAAKVCVAGSFNQWDPSSMPLAPGSDGEWTLCAALKPGQHEYRFVVDGVWQEDPAAADSILNPFGERNSLLVVK